MPFCPQCGAQNPDDAIFCTNCGVKMPEMSTITSPGTPTSSQPPPGVTTGVTTGPTPPGMPPPTSGAYPVQMYPVSRKEPALAAILSFLLTGLGHIYAGKVNKGIGLLIGIIACIFLFWLIIPIFIAMGLWIYGIIDSYTTAEKYNQFVARYGRPPTSQDQW